VISIGPRSQEVLLWNLLRIAIILNESYNSRPQLDHLLFSGPRSKADERRSRLVCPLLCIQNLKSEFSNFLIFYRPRNLIILFCFLFHGAAIVKKHFADNFLSRFCGVSSRSNVRLCNLVNQSVDVP
jgi:hypothetical protein